MLVNQNITSGWKYNSDVAMAANGNFAIVWQSYGQANAVDYGIYARMYNANGTDYVNSAGTELGEFHINANTVANGVPAVAMDAAGDFATVWAGEQRHRRDGQMGRLRSPDRFPAARRSAG